jgi:hypothetical protein
VRHRFSEFAELAAALHSAWPLPPKSFSVLRLSKRELASRAQALEGFLQHLADTVSGLVRVCVCAVLCSGLSPSYDDSLSLSFFLKYLFSLSLSFYSASFRSLAEVAVERCPALRTFLGGPAWEEWGNASALSGDGSLIPLLNSWCAPSRRGPRL